MSAVPLSEPRASIYRSSDLWIYLLLTLIAATSFIALWHPEFFGLSRQNGLSDLSVGEVWRKEGQVRTKEKNSVVWLDLFSSKAKVSMGDIVFTGPDGKAEINMKSGLQAELNPNSLIVIQQERPSSVFGNWLSWSKPSPTPAPVFQLKVGAFKVHSFEANHPLIIQAQGALYRLDPIQGQGEVNVQLATTTQGKNIKVSTESGAKVRISEIGNSKPSQAVDLSGTNEAILSLPANSIPANTQNIQENAWKLPGLSILPVNVDTRVVTKSELYSIPVKIQWQPIADATYDVQVFHGEKVVAEKQGLKTPYFGFEITALDKNPYLYQITVSVPSSTLTGSREKIQSERRAVNVIFSSPIVKIMTKRILRQKKVLITWARTSLTLRYMIEISQDPEFTHQVFSEETPMNLLLFPPEQSGPLYVRVKSLADAHESVWSETKRFVVK